MTDEKKTRRGAGLIAFALGLVVGKSGLRPLSHIMYIFIIIFTFFMAQSGPMNAYFTEMSSESSRQEIRQELEEEYQPKIQKDKLRIERLKNRIQVTDAALKHFKTKYYKEQDKNERKLEPILPIENAVYYHRDYLSGESTFVSRVITVDNNSVLYNSYEVTEDGIKSSTKGLLRPIFVFENRYNITRPSEDKKLIQMLDRMR